jgi:hypothetical protein
MTPQTLNDTPQNFHEGHRINPTCVNSRPGAQAVANWSLCDTDKTF